MAQDLQLRIRISADGRAAIEGTQQVERQVEKLGNTAGKVGALIAGYLSFQFLTGAVQELFKVQARLQDLQAQFQALAGERAADQFLYIQNAAQRLSMDLDGARSAYGKMLVMVDSGLLNIGQAQQMFEGLSAYARLAGASAEQVSNSMYGLSQALGQGRVQMTEVLQVTEPLPGSLNKIAAAAKMAVGEFRALIMDPAGPGVSSKQFGEWVQKAFGDAIPIAEQMAGTLSATWTRVKNDWRLFMEDMGSSSGFAEIAKTSLDGFSALLSGLDSPQFTNVARNFTAMFSSAISELFGVFQLLMDYIEELVMVYLGVKFVQAINIAVKAIEVYKTTVAAMMAQTTMQMTASQAAAIGLGAAIKASVAIIAPLLIIAAGAYLLLADNTDHAAVAQDAYNRVLQQTGGSLDELARKYKTLSDAQKATMTMQLSLDLKAQEDALKKLEADFKDTMERLRDNVASANGGMVFSGVNDAASNQLLNSMGFEQALTGDAEALAKFIKNVEDYKEAGGKLNVEIGNILFGHKNLLDMLKKSGIEFNKTKDSVDYTRDALDLVNGKLPQTASEFDKAGAAAQRAGKEFQDAINKDWSKLTSFGMNNAELAKVDAISQGATAAQQQLAVGLGTLKDQQEQLTAAIKTGKTELIDQAEQALRNAASLAIAAKGADAFGASMAGMQQDIAKGNLTQIEAARISNDAAEAEKQRAAVALDVEGMIQRARRESTKAGTEQIQELQETNQYLKLQQDLVNGVAVEWAGLKDLPAVLNSLQVDAGLPKKEAVDALVEYVKTYDSIPDKAQAAQAAQLALDNAIQNYTLNLKDTNAEEAKRSEELARQTELMMFQKQATDSLISAGSAQLSYTVADTEMKATVSSLEQIEEFYRRIGELQKEMAEGATDQRLKEMMSGFDNESVAAIDKLTVGLIAERDELKKHAPTWAELTGEVNDNTAVKETNAALTKILPTLLNDESVAREANAKTVAAEVDALKKINAAQQLAADGYTASLTPMEKYQAEIKNIAAAAKTLAERKDLGLISPEQLEKEQRGLQALTLEAEKTVNLTAQLFEDAAGSIAGEWNNMFEQLFTGNKDAFKDFANSLKDIFLKMLAQMAAAALAKPILIPMMQTMGGAFGLDQGMTGNIINGIMPGMGGGASTLMSGASGLGSLFGGGGGSLAGFLSMDGTTSFMGSELLGSLASGLAPVLEFIPMIGLAIGAITMLTDLFSGTPHPSSIATAGGFWTSENGPEYGGKGGTVAGDSGILYGYDYGHTDPEEAKKLRDGFMEIDKALTNLAPTVDLAGVKLGEFGNTAEGFVANGKYVDSMDEVTSGFVKAWVSAAAETEAVSALVNEGFQGMQGTAEDLLIAFSALQQMDAAGTLSREIIDIVVALESGSEQLAETMAALAMITGYADANPLADFEKALADSLKTTFGRLSDAGTALAEGAMNDAGKVIADGLANVDWTDASSIQELAGLVKNRYDLEMQMLMEINSYINGINTMATDSIESIKMSVMDTGEQYQYFTDKANEARAAMDMATDPAEITRLTAAAIEASMSAYNLLDDPAKQQGADAFIGFIEDIQGAGVDALNEAQTTVISEHEATAALLATAIESAGVAAAQSITDAATALETAVSGIDDSFAALTAAINSMKAGDSVSIDAMAAGGIVGGAWNGKSGIAGDTVLTALTPGEAVIPREQTQKHASLINAIMQDEVKYAAGGIPPYVPPATPLTNESGGATVTGFKDTWTTMVTEVDKAAADTADALADMMKGIDRSLRDLSFDDLERELAGINDTLAETVGRAYELGASETDLSKIRELSVAQTAAVFEAILKQLEEMATQINASFEGALESIRLSVMSDAEKYGYYTDIAESAFVALQTATDPTEIERLAGDIRDASMNAWGMLDEAQRKASVEGFEAFLQDAQQLTNDRLEVAQKAVLDQAEAATRAVAEAFGAAVESAKTAAVLIGASVNRGAERIDAAGQSFGNGLGAALKGGADGLSGAFSTGSDAIGNAIKAALLATPITVTVNTTPADVGGMAAGGIVPGAWNGKAGIAGDTILTALTPGEAVIPREQAGKHAALIDAIMQDEVRYAAAGLPATSFASGGFLPDQPESSWNRDTNGQNQADQDAEKAAEDAARAAEQIADLIQKLTREFRDLTAVTDFDRSLANLNDTLADTAQQITDLGGSAEATALANQIQAEEERRLREELTKAQTELLQPYQDAADGLSQLDQALRDLDRKTADELTKAAELGMTDTSLITNERDKEAGRLRDDNATSLAELLAGVAEPLGELDQQMQSLRESTDATREQAQQLGATYGELQTINASYLRQMEDIAKAAYEERSAIVATYAADKPTELQAAITALWKEADVATERFMELGGSASEAAAITEGAAAMEAKLRADNADALAELLTGVAEPMRELDQQMQALKDSTAATREQAKALGATYGDLQAINASYLRQMEEIAKAAYEERSAILATYAIDGPNEFEQSIVALWKEADTAKERLMELGGDIEQAGLIALGAAEQERKLRKERADSLADLLSGFALEPLTAFEQSLSAVTKQAKDAKESADDLGASHEQLAQIDAWAAQETARLIEERKQALVDFMSGFEIGPVAAFEKALYDMNRQMDANLKQATELGATEADLAKIRDWTGDQAVKTAQSAIDQEIATFESAATAIASTLEQISNSLRQLKDSIEANLLDMNRLKPDWNEVDYQSGRVTDLQGQLASSDELPIDQRISLAEQLRGAIMARYQAELSANEKLQQEQEKADTEHRQNLERLVQIAKSLKSYLDSLKLSDLSILSPEQKLAEAQRQYQDTLGKAQTGDMDAQEGLQGAAQAYLTEARSYYASTEAYAGIFDQVTSTLTTLESLWRIQGESGLTALDQPLTAFETESLALADAAARELETILPKLSDWQAEAITTAQTETDKLRETLNANTALITEALTASGLLIGTQLSEAIAAMTATVTTALQAQASQLQAAQAQAVASQQVAASAAAAASASVPRAAASNPPVVQAATPPAPYPVTMVQTGSAQTAAVITPTKTYYAASTAPPVVRRAGGGYTDPGWTMVGEEGPELVNFTAPNRVYTAADTLRMMSDNDSSEDTEAVVIELKALIRLQSSANQQLINKLDAVESRLAGIESKARLEAAA